MQIALTILVSVCLSVALSAVVTKLLINYAVKTFLLALDAAGFGTKSPKPQLNKDKQDPPFSGVFHYQQTIVETTTTTEPEKSEHTCHEPRCTAMGKHKCHDLNCV